LLADFTGEHITSDAGALLLREADRKLGLTESLAKRITDPREQDQLTHSVLRMLRQRIYGIALGYEDLIDHATLREDELFKILAESNETLASTPTLCRFENGIDRRSLVRMSVALVETFIASFATPPEELILDFDATDDPVHGKQELSFFHGYYDNYCFLPLYVFCGERLLVAYLRPSNIDAAKHSRAILKLLVKRFREVWPNVRIIVRGDSGFCRWETMRWCEKNRVEYIFGIARNAVLERLAWHLSENAKEVYEQTHEKQRIFGEVRYAAQTWDVERRVIVKAEHMEKGANPRFVVTSLPGEAQYLYDEIYCQRGELENRIKEQQLDLYADRTSAHRFVANQFRLLLASAAYVLVEYIRRVGLANTELENAQCGTIRLKLFKLGARIVKSVRRIVVHIASCYPYAQILRRVSERLVPCGSASLTTLSLPKG
jgi:hypothetical protein